MRPKIMVVLPMPKAHPCVGAAAAANAGVADWLPATGPEPVAAPGSRGWRISQAMSTIVSNGARRATGDTSGWP